MAETEDDNPPDELLISVPESLHVLVCNHWQDWCRSCEQKGIEVTDGIPVSTLGKTWACSDYIARNTIRYPEMLRILLHEGMVNDRSLEVYRELVSEAISSVDEGDQASMMRTLRELRQQEMVRIAWRDLNQLASIDVILQEQTDLAVAFVTETIAALEAQQAEKFGMPLDANGEVQSLLVFAMGKMGGGELNFSSDIDLIFAYSDDGETTGRRKTSHQEFYRGVITQLVKMLDAVTADGFVYRVDTRLRPFGNSGPVAMSFSGLEQYYQLHGRDWERYAMIKAKLICGRARDVKLLQSMLTPFVYRRYLDFSMIESIRDMKSMIAEQMKRKGMSANIKLGRGGIREIEFIGQTMQLIRAGREPELRERSILKVIALLAEKEYLSADEAESLTSAYRFLRKLENRLQILNDKQTHVLPDDETAQRRITLAMGFSEWQALLDELSGQQQAVDEVFKGLIAEQEADDSQSTSAFSVYWAGSLNAIDTEDTVYHELEQYLLSQGYQQAGTVIKVLDDFHTCSSIRNLPADSARLMSKLISSLVEKIVDYPDQAILLERVIRILKALAGRKVYISLLNEYPKIQMQMLTLCSTSEWFTERLTRYPILLDSQLHSAESFRDQQTDIRELLELELNRLAGEAAGDDLELYMERMRQFKRQTVFTIAMLDVFYGEPVESVSDHLTDLADALLEKILAYSWREMVNKYGEPRCVIDGDSQTPTMGIIAYGKMGGNELGYGSDLDIIFVHDSSGERQYTAGKDGSGERSIDNQQFFARVAQRVIHFLNTRTYSGILYEADTRLRPDGQSGLMVSSIIAFEAYQLEKAWTWEHQALTRARFVTEIVDDNQAGNARLQQEFDRIRSSVLRQTRDRDELMQEVVKMRQKMRDHLSGKSEAFDLKQDAGGLVDIEFMTQAGVLLNAETCADCIRHTATLELIRELQVVDFYSAQEAAHLSEAYRVFRKMKNWQNLQCDTGNIASAEEIEILREKVVSAWKRLMPAASDMTS